MSDVDRLFSEFTAARSAGEEVSPREYLARVSGVDRAELGALIEAYLERAPRRQFDAARYRGSTAERVVETMTGGWPAVLPRWRDEARVPREELTTRLADALGVGDRAEKVHRYYHEMERGKLPSRGVSDRVLEALGSILGRSAEAVRRAGEGLAGAGPAAGGADATPAFARMSHAPAPAAAGPPPDALASSASSNAEEEPWDEVDELFRGGA
jgi:hypothetical protein